ncbi:putative membrane protein (TIGR04086 family) [Gracilibacillus halotolerans]|uniref:Putative membrane protein (TIGR04086 family) n=1 Tax=Gracilibacillus halotolerans TaxID=74386 RepID=A0A841RJ71_9BACI|nr:TIGR04086 family membrane protein [Gracilibacillus halotolerans]MBB6511917.1 putative membrane protein (TIGR04086 family) [Gracilibacillus halotolerans]
MMKGFISMLYGWVSILAVILLASLILSLLLRFTSLGESTLNLVTLLLSFLALFVGGFVAGMKAKKRGLIIGLSTGLCFTLFVFCYRYLGLNTGFQLADFVNHGAYLLLAMLGAIFGVNLSGGDPDGTSS